MDAATETHATAAADGTATPELSEAETAIQDALVDTKEAAKEDADVEVAVVDWSEAAWFSGCDGDLGAAFWLLRNSHERNDIGVLESSVLAQRAVVLQRLHTRFTAELQPQVEPTEGGDSETGTTTKRWTTAAEIVDDVLEAISVETKQTSGGSNTVMQLIREVANVATEVLVARVASEEAEQLTRWESHLASLWPEQITKSKVAADLRDGQDDAAPKVGDGADNTGDAPVSPVKVSGNEMAEVAVHPLPPPTAKRIVPRKGSIAYMKWQVRNAIDFHQSCDQLARATIGNDEQAPATAAAQWTQEIKSLFEATFVSPEEEADRVKVAAQIQDVVRTSNLWRFHDVLLFGSSLSKFGSRTSDLDLCLFSPHAHSSEQSGVPTKPSEPYPHEGHQLHATSRNDDASFLKELLDKALQAMASLHRTTETMKTTATVKASTKLQRRLLLLAHWTALSVALQHYYQELAGSDARSCEKESASASANTLTKHEAKCAKEAAAAHKLALEQHRKKVKKEVYATAGLLGRFGCNVSTVVPRGRVPMVGFTHRASGFECDLCFGNYYAVINTHLQRTYANCDERARMLGFAIKHWAKRRGICDSVNGFLSSYSYIMLTIFFLQTKANVLPNLQHPQLLREASVASFKLNGGDVRFCVDAAKAKAFHVAQLEKMGLPSENTQSVGELLLSFFRFYAEEFNFSHHVVSVCQPEHAVPKKTRWHGKKLKTWRISIEDPLEPDRDLGSVLLLECQQQIIVEIKRALKLLREGHSFETVVCEPVAETKKAPKTNTHVPKSAPKPTKDVMPPAAPAPRDGTAAMADRDLWPTLGDAPKKKDEPRKAPGKAHGVWRGNWRSLTPARGRGRGRGLPTRDASPTMET